jgi:hypothetical protein
MTIEQVTQLFTLFRSRTSCHSYIVANVSIMKSHQIKGGPSRLPMPRRIPAINMEGVGQPTYAQQKGEGSTGAADKDRRAAAYRSHTPASPLR